MKTHRWFVSSWVALGVFMLATSGWGADGVWINVNGGTWSDPLNWASGTIADGIAATGDVSTINITAGRTITLDSDRTLGHAIFGDSDNNQQWTLDDNGRLKTTLTLDAGIGFVPTINVINQIFHLRDVSLAGTSGLTKLGGGEIRIYSSANPGLSGKVSLLGGGTLVKDIQALGVAPASFTADALYINNASLKNLEHGSFVTVEPTRGITIENNAYFTVGWNSMRHTMSLMSPVTGTGSLNVNYDGGVIMLGNTANNYTGDTVIGSKGPTWYNNSGAQANLRLGKSNVIPDGAGYGSLRIPQDASTRIARLDMYGYDETVNGLFGTGSAQVTNMVPSRFSTLTVGNNDTSSDFGGYIGGALNLTKIGTGTLVLSNANYLTGTTAIQGGTLALGPAGQINNSTIMVGASGVFDVTASTVVPVGALATLAGVGTVAGNVSVAATSRINPGSIGGVGTLTLQNDLTLASGGANLSPDLLGAGGGDLLVVNGQFTPNSSTLAMGRHQNGTYTIVNYGTLVGTFGGGVAGTRKSYAFDYTTAGQIDLTVSGPEYGNLIWRGTSSANWNKTQGNWSNTVTAATGELFYDMDAVTFNNDGANALTVTLTENVAPYSVAVDGANNYTFQGVGQITGSAALLKTGAGTLTVNNTNAYTGGTVITGGRVLMGNVLALGAEDSTVVVTNGGTLDVRGLDLRHKNLIIGGGGVNDEGAVVNTGSGQNNATRMVTLAGDTIVGGTARWDIRKQNINNNGEFAYLNTGGNPYSYTKVGGNQHNWVDVTVDNALGDIHIRGGILGLENFTSPTLGDANYTLTVYSNATFQFYNYQNVLAKPIVHLGGSKMQVDNGGTETTQNRIGGPIAISNGVVSIDINSGVVLSYFQGITGDGGLATVDNGVLRLNGANTYTGPTIIGGNISGATVLQSNGTITASSQIVLSTGRLLLDNTRSLTDNLTDRVADTIPVIGQGGQFVLRGLQDTNTTETIGTVTLEKNMTSIRVENGAGTLSSSALFLSGLNLAGGGADFSASGLGTLGAGTTNSLDPHVYIGGQADGFMPFATANYGANLASYTQANGVSVIVPSAEFDGVSDQTGTDTSFTATRGGASDVLNAARSVNSLTVTSPGAGKYVDLAGFDLTLTTGGILLNSVDPFTFVNSTGSGAITGPADVVLAVANPTTGVLRVNAPINAGNALWKTGPGTAILLGANAWSGGMNVAAGVLQVGEGGAGATLGTGTINLATILRVNNSDNLPIADTIQGDGRIEKYGTGTLTLSGANNYTNGTLVYGGTLSVTSITDDNTGQLGPAVMSNLDRNYFEMFNASELQVTGVGTSMTARRMYMDNSGASSTITVANASGVLQWDGRISGNAGHQIYLPGPGTMIFSGVGDNNSGHFTLLGGTAVLAKTSSGSVHSIGGAVTNMGGVILFAGTGDDQLWSGSSMHMTAGTIDLNGRNEAWNQLTGTGGVIENGTASTTSRITVGGGDVVFNFTGVIQDGAGVMAVTKTGAGATTLGSANPNTFTGGLQLYGGIAGLAGSEGFGAGHLDSRVTMHLNGFNQTLPSIQGAYAARVINTTGVAALTIGAGNANTTQWAGPLQESDGGTLALVKTGNGTAVLQGVGVSTLSGGVNVNGGRLAIDSAPNSTVNLAAGAVAGLVNDFGGVTVDASEQVDLGATVAGGAITLNGGVLNLTAAGLYEGSVAENNHNTAAANPATAVRLGTSYAQTTDTTLFPGNTTYMYDGFVVNPGPANVTWTFGEQFDDGVRVAIDGTDVLNDGAWSTPTMGTVTLSPGYHSFLARFAQGGGGVGPNNNWPIGFGYDPQGRATLDMSYFQMMAEDGSGSMFVVSTSAYTIANALNVTADSRVDLTSLAVPTFTNTMAIGANKLEIGGAAGRRVNFNGALTLGGTAIFDVASNGVTAAIGGDIGDGAGGYGLTKDGPGNLILSGVSTYGGNTVVNDGTLQVDGAITGSGSVTINSDAILKGTGSIAGLITMAGTSTLAPGASPGTLTISNGLSMAVGSTFEVELTGTLAGEFDVVQMTGGALTLSGTGITVLGDDTTYALGTIFPVIQGYGSRAGTFGVSQVAGSGAGGNVYAILYDQGLGADELQLQVIPEPAALGALGLAVVAMLLRRRMRG